MVSVYVISYAGFVQSVEVNRCETVPMARAVAGAMPNERTAFIIEGPDSFNALKITGATVIKLFNTFAAKPIAKFETRAVGQERLFNLITEKFGIVELTEVELPAGASPDPEPTTTQTDAAAADPSLTEDIMAGKKKVAKKVAKKAAATDGSGRTRKNADAKITLLAKENPKRPASDAYKRFAKYKTGMTVGEALKAGVTSGDLAYDVKHEFIRIAG
jgi:hypothetical protein